MASQPAGETALRGGSIHRPTVAGVYAKGTVAPPEMRRTPYLTVGPGEPDYFTSRKVGK